MLVTQAIISVFKFSSPYKYIYIFFPDIHEGKQKLISEENNIGNIHLEIAKVSQSSLKNLPEESPSIPSNCIFSDGFQWRLR